MSITDRFAKLWEQWDGNVRHRGDVPEFLKNAKDEDLVELLAATSPTTRKYERDIIATEVLNRLHRRHHDLPNAASEVLNAAEIAYDAAAEGQRAIHAAEGILKAQGEQELGETVSAAAYASLDTTRLAFEAAQKNSADVQATVAQSRVANHLAEDAAAQAKIGSDATRAAARTLEAAGHKQEADAAHKAATQITEAAKATVDASRGELQAEGEPHDP